MGGVLGEGGGGDASSGEGVRKNCNQQIIVPIFPHKNGKNGFNDNQREEGESSLLFQERGYNRQKKQRHIRVHPTRIRSKKGRGERGKKSKRF